MVALKIKIDGEEFIHYAGKANILAKETKENNSIF